MTHRHARAAACGLLVVAALGLPAASSQTPTRSAVALARLDTLPHDTHNSTIRADTRPGTAGLRLWIDANEDDLRLYTPAGGQMDADIQVSTVVTRGAMPDRVVVRFESRGTLQPGTTSRALSLRADGVPLVVVGHDEPDARSGLLLFLATRAEIPLETWLTLVTSATVEGRVWDVGFTLLPSQLELLRAWTRRLMAEAGSS